jgi:hypothetical protein
MSDLSFLLKILERVVDTQLNRFYPIQMHYHQGGVLTVSITPEKQPFLKCTLMYVLYMDTGKVILLRALGFELCF